MSEYLKPESVYNDRYDLFTIEDCLQHTRSWHKVSDGILNEEEKERGFTLGLKLHLYYIKGERYKRKASTISEWMAKDRSRDGNKAS